jgi:Zn-dependent protease with chaperone function
MNFFERQSRARSQSRLWIGVFLLAVVGVVLAVNAGVVIALTIFDDRYARGFFSQAQLYTPILWTVSILVSGAIALASLYKTMQLRSGGSVVALSMGAERVRADTGDIARRRLRNVVEEMAIAAGVPVPETYVLERESGINAFAAGHTPANAAIVVTRGLLEHLNRDELQGVIAHEFSHILNGDIRLNVRMLGLLFGIQSLSIAGRKVMRFTSESGADDARVAVPVWLSGFALLVIGWLGLLFGRMIQAAVSRQREHLADASAVQFTRNPQGLRGALVKIGALHSGSRIVATDAEAVAHMLFAASSRLATHPPLLERIRALDPRFQASEFDAVRKQLMARVEANAPPKDPAEKISAARKLESLLTASVAVTPSAVDAMVGNPTAAQLDWAHVLRVSLPETILLATADAPTATGLLFALALDDEAEAQARQQKFIAAQMGERIANAVAYWLPHARALNLAQRQPALLRLMPVLRQQARADRLSLLSCLNGLLQREGAMRLQNYTLRKLAQVHLQDGIAPAAMPGRANVQSHAQELALLFAVVAQSGHQESVQARHAYHAGLSVLLPHARTEFEQINRWSAQLDMALTKLDRLNPLAKEKLVQALVKTIAHDMQLTVSEAELLRAICATLHCPLPPLWPSDTADSTVT